MIEYEYVIGAVAVVGIGYLIWKDRKRKKANKGSQVVQDTPAPEQKPVKPFGRYVGSFTSPYGPNGETFGWLPVGVTKAGVINEHDAKTTEYNLKARPEWSKGQKYTIEGTLEIHIDENNVLSLGRGDIYGTPVTVDEKGNKLGPYNTGGLMTFAFPVVAHEIKVTASSDCKRLEGTIAEGGMPFKRGKVLLTKVE